MLEQQKPHPKTDSETSRLNLYNPEDQRWLTQQMQDKKRDLSCYWKSLRGGNQIQLPGFGEYIENPKLNVGLKGFVSLRGATSNRQGVISEEWGGLTKPNKYLRHRIIDTTEAKKQIEGGVKYFRHDAISPPDLTPVDLDFPNQNLNLSPQLSQLLRDKNNLAKFSEQINNQDSRLMIFLDKFLQHNHIPSSFAQTIIKEMATLFIKSKTNFKDYNELDQHIREYLNRNEKIVIKKHESVSGLGVTIIENLDQWKNYRVENIDEISTQEYIESSQPEESWQFSNYGMETSGHIIAETHNITDGSHHVGNIILNNDVNTVNHIIREWALKTLIAYQLYCANWFDKKIDIEDPDPLSIDPEREINEVDWDNLVTQYNQLQILNLGVDILISTDGKPKIVEVNPRPTAAFYFLNTAHRVFNEKRGVDGIMSKNIPLDVDLSSFIQPSNYTNFINRIMQLEINGLKFEQLISSLVVNVHPMEHQIPMLTISIIKYKYWSNEYFEQVCNQIEKTLSHFSTNFMIKNQSN